MIDQLPFFAEKYYNDVVYPWCMNYYGYCNQQSVLAFLLSKAAEENESLDRNENIFIDEKTGDYQE